MLYFAGLGAEKVDQNNGFANYYDRYMYVSILNDNNGKSYNYNASHTSLSTITD